MSDEEDYDSEDDVDYVPQAEDVSEEENSGEEEDLTVLGITDKLTTGTRKKTKSKDKTLGPRKRKGGIKLDDEVAATDTPPTVEKDEENIRLSQQIEEEKQEKIISTEKKKVDDLWSSFISDVKVPPKKSIQPSKGLSNSTSVSKPENGGSSSLLASLTDKKDPPGKMVEVTKVFDFAGEEVKVTKIIHADSKEGIKVLKSQEEAKSEKVAPEKAVPILLGKPVAGSVISNVGIKRPVTGGGLGGILNKIGKKQKISVLDKSKMDWNNFKKDEGIEDELKLHGNSKEGYIERMKFLERTDLRQFEIEKNLRLSGKR